MQGILKVHNYLLYRSQNSRCKEPQEVILLNAIKLKIKEGMRQKEEQALNLPWT